MKTAYPSILAGAALAFICSTATVQAQFNYMATNGMITITGYTGPGGDVVVPDTINGLPVLIIGDGAFAGCANLTSITIPNSVVSIGQSAFGSCTTLSQVTLGNQLYRLGGAAFAFCVSLVSITIPASVCSIGINPFASCTNMGAIGVDERNPRFSSVDGVLFDDVENRLITYPPGKAETAYTIPDGVRSIGQSAFSVCYDLVSITIPDSVTNIGNSAFGNCTGLPGLVIPNSVLTIGEAAFAGCANLTDIMIPDSVTTLGDTVFYDCSRLSNVTIGKRVPAIGRRTFFLCSSLRSVTLPDSVTSVGREAFSYCAALGVISIPTTITWIASLAFSDCTSLTGVYFQGNAPETGSGIFNLSEHATAYYLPGAVGWGYSFCGRPTALWVLPYPVILTTGSNFGIQTNAFGFRISWATNASVVVEASTTLANSIWSPVSTNTLVSGWVDFSDAEWTNYPARFYRIRSQ